MRLTLTLAAFAFAGLSAVAHAQPVQISGDVATLDVPYADLNLSHPAGAETMLNRIKAAAARVCGGKPDAREMHAAVHYRTCVQTATQSAVAQLNATRVTALYTGRANLDQSSTQETSLSQR
ncbi:MAG: UrcA family protein [Alphaproteobacteria bacterium]|nr:UrcA family protein [Alphaproteobacteria bacterium]